MGPPQFPQIGTGCPPRGVNTSFAGKHHNPGITSSADNDHAPHHPAPRRRHAATARTGCARQRAKPRLPGLFDAQPFVFVHDKKPRNDAARRAQYLYRLTGPVTTPLGRFLSCTKAQPIKNPAKRDKCRFLYLRCCRQRLYIFRAVVVLPCYPEHYIRRRAMNRVAAALRGFPPPITVPMAANRQHQNPTSSFADDVVCKQIDRRFVNGGERIAPELHTVSANGQPVTVNRRPAPTGASAIIARPTNAA